MPSFSFGKGAPRVIADRYALEVELASGGMGTVWVARDDKLGRKVAVKLMAQGIAMVADAQQRFEREARAVAQLRSVHVVEVYDYGMHEGAPFMVMELLDGESLADRLKRVPRVGLREAAEILAQMCRGLRAAHGAGLVHRDLKPGNIFLTHRDDVEVVKLLDFGIVKARDVRAREQTAVGVVLGTPQFMSPEQARGAATVDSRTDLWATAVIAFRMLTGENPFTGKNFGEIIEKLCSDVVPSVRDHVRELPVALDAFFAKGLARDRERRFQTAEELSTAFLDVARGEFPSLPVALPSRTPPRGLGPSGSGSWQEGAGPQWQAVAGATTPEGAVLHSAALQGAGPQGAGPQWQAAAGATMPEAAVLQGAGPQWQVAAGANRSSEVAPNTGELATARGIGARTAGRRNGMAPLVVAAGVLFSVGAAFAFLVASPPGEPASSAASALPVLPTPAGASTAEPDGVGNPLDLDVGGGDKPQVPDATAPAATSAAASAPAAPVRPSARPTASAARSSDAPVRPPPSSKPKWF